MLTQMFWLAYTSDVLLLIDQGHILYLMPISIYIILIQGFHLDNKKV